MTSGAPSVKATAQIKFAHQRDIAQFSHRPGDGDLAVLHEIAARRHRQSQSGILLDQQALTLQSASRCSRLWP